jgi:hypothetical protein
MTLNDFRQLLGNCVCVCVCVRARVCVRAKTTYVTIRPEPNLMSFRTVPARFTPRSAFIETLVPG